jgi:two-component system, cell cycle sensor histidine kinase and response regulator CckA
MPAILVVDDDRAVLKLVQSCLRVHGYETLTATTAAEAQELFAKRQEGVVLLLADINMPGTDGPTLARELLERKPALHILFMSGFAEIDWPETAFIHRFAFIGKPFTPGLLVRILKDLLGPEAGR